jgi:hypothetical protein
MLFLVLILIHESTDPHSTFCICTKKRKTFFSATVAGNEDHTMYAIHLKEALLVVHIVMLAKSVTRVTEHIYQSHSMA